MKIKSLILSIILCVTVAAQTGELTNMKDPPQVAEITNLMLVPPCGAGWTRITYHLAHDGTLSADDNVIETSPEVKKALAYLSKAVMETIPVSVNAHDMSKFVVSSLTWSGCKLNGGTK